MLIGEEGTRRRRVTNPKKTHHHQSVDQSGVASIGRFHRFISRLPSLLVFTIRNHHQFNPKSFLFAAAGKINNKKIKMAAGADTHTTISGIEVIKSPNDKRLYRLIQLTNGLQAILIHDPNIFAHHDDEDMDEEDDNDDEDDMDAESDDDDDEDDMDAELDDDDDELDEEDNVEEDAGKKKKGGGRTYKKAAAALCVGMGSFSDPVQAQGLAHFLEHMLFMGSTPFPDENEYDSFLSKHGGSSNAYTETDHTCYHFEVKRDFLKGALERFSQFFISPLMKPDAMDREILAVDSEFNQVLQSDACRLQQLQCHTAAPAHPFNRFFWGNKKSLLDAKEKGIDLRQHILTLYDTFYHAGLMKLVVIGGEPLDVLQDWAVELFSPIKKDVQVKPQFNNELPIWKSGKLYRIEAVKDVHTLELSWTLPSLRQHYLKRSEDYISHLIGHEGEGSLYYFLKTRGWVTSLSAGVGDEGLHRSSIAYVFLVSVNLTDSGLDKIYEIIGYVYQYIKLLRQVSPQEWIFKEIQNISQMEFRFAEEQPQDDYVAELAANLFVYPAEHVIYGEHAYEIWDPERIKYVLDFLRPGNMRIDVQSKSCDKSKDILYEPWFGSKYTEEDVSISLMDLWKDPPEIDVSLNLPPRNEFIPCNFSIRADDNNLVSVSSPICIRNEPSMKIWYKLDNTFKLPRANAYFRITLKGGHDSVKNCILTELFVLLLKDKLNDIVYQASVAKLETSLSIISDKLELRVYGFNDKLPVLLSKVLAITTSFIPTEDRFKVIKEDMERNLKNANMRPLNQSSYLRLQILCQRMWDYDDKLSSLNDLSLADLNSFTPNLLSHMYIDGLCHGNMLEEEATSLSDIFKVKLCAQPLPVEMRHKERVICLPSGANIVKDMSVKNKLETNSVIELYFQIEPESGNETTKLKAFIDLFDEIVTEPLFNQLRTTEQLGYVVDCSPRVTYRVHGLCFCVQSSKYNPVYLQGRVESFIDGLESLLEKLDKESFESYKSGLIAKLLEKDPSLTYETDRYWGQILDERYMFDMSLREVEELRSIEKSEIIKWYKTYMVGPSPKCRKLAIRVWGCNTEATSIPKAQDGESLLSTQFIEDIAAFKASSEFYPSIC